MSAAVSPAIAPESTEDAVRVSARTEARIGAVLLAAGRGSRMGLAGSKMTLPFGASTVVGTTLRALLDADVFGEIVVVTGHAAAEVEAAVHGTEARVVHNADWASGLARSIACGARALGGGAVAVVLGDLPLVQPATVRAVAAAFARLGDPVAVVRAAFRNQPGHPVVFGADHAEALRAGDGPALARGAVLIAVSDAGAVSDLDTPDAYQAALYLRASAPPHV